MINDDSKNGLTRADRLSRDTPARVNTPGIRNGHDNRPVVITGGAGFIGTNLAHRLLQSKRKVILYDNLSRPGVQQNLAWLKLTHGELVEHEDGDIRDPRRLKKVISEASQVFHFAAQVAVTTSLHDPVEDFEINARGTLNLLEAIRGLNEPPSLVFTSTNKIYGDLKQVRLRRATTRYEPQDKKYCAHGFGEQQALNFHSPYGCSKGSACQYVLDYARTFKLPAAVFCMSCIYGPHQFGTEDQGWVAHFLIKALENTPITIYGDGRQVRDILFVEDLVDAFLLAQENMAKVTGEMFNMGGGPFNSISLLEILDLMRELCGHELKVQYDEWRLADQQYYVSDTRKFNALTGWSPKVPVRTGIARLFNWLIQQRRFPSPNGCNFEGLATKSKASSIRTKGIPGRRNGKPRPPRLISDRKPRSLRLVQTR